MFIKDTLSSGVRVVTEEVPAVHSVALGIWVRTGSRNETEQQHGVSHFLEHLLFKGTAKRTAKQIAEALEAVGGQLNAFTTKEYTCYYAKVLADHLDLAIDILTDMFFNSLMDPNDIAKEKNVILEEIKMYEDSPDELVHDLFAKTVWKGHPLGRAILGTAESVQQIQRQDIIDYYNSQYVSENVVVAVAGKIKHPEIMERLAPMFSKMTSGHRSVSGEAPTPQTAVRVQEKEIEQVHICLGTPALSQDSEDVYPLHVLNNVLGGGLSSRLFQQIREDRGLAYSVYSYHTTYFDSGLFAVYAGTSLANLKQVTELIGGEIISIRDKGILPDELQRTKDQIKGNLLLGLENVSSRMSRLGKTELCFDRIVTAEEVVERISKVTLEQILELGRRLFAPEKFTITAIGPQVDQIDFQEIINTMAG
ncbi:MAG: M16 family metallopeptidase [Bacillota bacterium]